MKKALLMAPKPLLPNQENIKSLEHLFQSGDAMQRQVCEENANLREQIAITKQQLERIGVETTEQQYGEILHQIRANKLHLTQKEEEIAELRKNVSDMEDEVTKLQQLAEARARELEFTDDEEICGLEHEINEAENELQSLGMENSELHNKYECYAVENAQLSSEKQELEAENSRLLEESRLIAEQLEDATHNLVKFQKQKNSVEQRLQLAHAELDRVKRNNLGQIRQMDGLVKASIYEQSRIEQAYNVLKERIKFIEEDLERGEIDMARRERQLSNISEITTSCEEERKGVEEELIEQLTLCGQVEAQFEEMEDVMRQFCSRYIGDCKEYSLKEIADKTLQVLLDSEIDNKNAEK